MVLLDETKGITTLGLPLQDHILCCVLQHKCLIRASRLVSSQALLFPILVDGFVELGVDAGTDSDVVVALNYALANSLRISCTCVSMFRLNLPQPIPRASATGKSIDVTQSSIRGGNDDL